MSEVIASVTIIASKSKGKSISMVRYIHVFNTYIYFSILIRSKQPIIERYTPLKISNGTNAIVYLSKLDITSLRIF